MPNYEFSGIWSREEFLLIRTHWVSERDNRMYGVIREHWDDVHLDIRHFPQAEELPDRGSIVTATLANRPLIARTELYDEGGRQRAVLEYPVRTMNVLPVQAEGIPRDPPQFQVDTGPLIVPDFGSTAEHQIERFDMGYVVYQEVRSGGVHFAPGRCRCRRRSSRRQRRRTTRPCGPSRPGTPSSRRQSWLNPSPVRAGPPMVPPQSRGTWIAASAAMTTPAEGL